MKEVNINQKWIKEKRPCVEAVEWWHKNGEEKNAIVVLKKLLAEKRYNWANWLIVRLMDYRDYVSYAVFAAEEVVKLYEKKYPADHRPWAAGAAGAAEAATWAAWAAEAAGAAIQLKTLNYGMNLLMEAKERKKWEE